MALVNSWATSPEKVVTGLYEGLLRRPPDDDGLVLYVNQLREGESIAALIEKFVGSDEFRSGSVLSAPSFPLDDAPPMRVQTQVSPDDRRAIWAHIAGVWSDFGEVDPFWSVLTDERWRARNMDSEAAIEAFYATGEAEGRRLDAWLARNDVSVPRRGRCVEYGCGLGRITHALFRRVGHVAAYDISAPHLEAARKRLTAAQIGHIDYRLVRGEADLPQTSDVDLFYSIIVLQHNPPPVILDILSRAFASLKPGGLAFFQVPTYGRDYSFTVEDYWVEVAAEKTMEMHFVPQRTILELGQAFDVWPLEVQPDWCIGNAEKWISSTFLMRKGAAPA